MPVGLRQDWAYWHRYRLVRRHRFDRRLPLGDPGSKGVLDQFGIHHRQTVLGFQDGDRAGLQLILRQGFDPWSSWAPIAADSSALSFSRTGGLVRSRAGTGWLGLRRCRAGIGSKPGGDDLMCLPRLVGGIRRRVEVVLACHPHHRK